MNPDCNRKTLFLKAGILILAFFLSLRSSWAEGPPLQCFPSSEEAKGCVGNILAPLRFAAFGDWGWGSADQMAVALALQKKCANARCHFVLLLGDNFYPGGVKNADDPLFQNYFEKIYEDVTLPFYPVLGNHDARGSVKAQIDYTQKSTKWFFPSRYYSLAYPENGSLVEFFAVDVTDVNDIQKRWLENSLKTSKARWKILVLHYPFFSNGKHGDNDRGMASQLAPLVCGKVDLILSGHDHDKEYLIGQKGTCTFRQIVVGTGGRSLRTVTPDKRTLFSASTFGFTWFEVNFDKILFEFVDTTRKVEYSNELRK